MHLPAHGDVSLAQEGNWRMIVRKGKVEIGNSGLFFQVMPGVYRANPCIGEEGHDE